MGGRGSSSASAVSGGAAKGEKKTASVNADRHKKYLAGELGTKVTKNDEFMMNTVFPGMNYNKVRHSKSSTYAYADRVSKDGERINVTVSADNIKVFPAYAVLSLRSRRRDSNLRGRCSRVLETRTSASSVTPLWRNRFAPSGSPGNLSQSSPRGCLFLTLLFACRSSGDPVSGWSIKQLR